MICSCSTIFAAFVIVTVFGATDAELVGALVVGSSPWSCCMAAPAALNVAAERLAYRRLRRAPKLAPLITAVGLSFVFQFVGVLTNGSAQKHWRHRPR